MIPLKCLIKIKIVKELFNFHVGNLMINFTVNEINWEMNTHENVYRNISLLGLASAIELRKKFAKLRCLLIFFFLTVILTMAV